MDATVYENDHHSYLIRNVDYAETSMAENRDEISIMVDPLSGDVHFSYDPKTSGNLEYERFWDNATAVVSGRYGVITGQSLSAQGVRYFSIALDRSTMSGVARNIHVYISKVNASERPAPDEGSWSGAGTGK
jgi:hypothetical protein